MALHGQGGARTSDGSWRTGTWVRSVSHYAIATAHRLVGPPGRQSPRRIERPHIVCRSCFAIFFPVAIPERPHPFPSRTRKLSSPGPMVLQGQLCGRVGRYRGLFEQPASNEAGCSLFRRVGRSQRPSPRHAPGPPPNGPDRRSRRRGPHSPVRQSRDPTGGNALASVWRARGVGQEAEGASGGGERGRPLGAGGGAPLGRAQTVLAPTTPDSR